MSQQVEPRPRAGVVPRRPLSPPRSPRELFDDESFGESFDVATASTDRLLRELVGGAMFAARVLMEDAPKIARIKEIRKELQTRLRPTSSLRAGARAVDSVEFVTVDELVDFFRVPLQTAIGLATRLGGVRMGQSYRVPTDRFAKEFGAETAFKLVVFVKRRELARLGLSLADVLPKGQCTVGGVE